MKIIQNIRKQFSISLVISGLLLNACHSDIKNIQTNELSDNELSLNVEQYKNAGILVGSILSKPLTTVLKVSGKIDVPPQNMVSISVPLGGYLKSTKLLPGMHLNKGEVIAIMEDQQYIQLQQDYLMAKANFSYIEGEYLRQKELNQSKASSDKVYELARASFLTQKITISALGEKLKLIGINPAGLNENNISKSVEVISPINGFVSQVNINIGKYVTPSDILFELVNPTDIHLNMMVFEKDIHKLFIGQKVTAFTNTNPGKKYLCDIILVGKDVSDQRYIDVHCHFENYDKNLIPGMYMNAEIELKSGDGIVLPVEAVVKFEGKNYIFIESGVRKYVMHEIQVGLIVNDFVEILDSEKFGNKKIVIAGAYALLMMARNKENEDE